METELIVTKQYAAKLILTIEEVEDLRGICRAWREHQRLLPDVNQGEANLVSRLLEVRVPPTYTEVADEDD